MPPSPLLRRRPRPFPQFPGPDPGLLSFPLPRPSPITSLEKISAQPNGTRNNSGKRNDKPDHRVWRGTRSAAQANAIRCKLIALLCRPREAAVAIPPPLLAVPVWVATCAACPPPAKCAVQRGEKKISSCLKFPPHFCQAK